MKFLIFYLVLLPAFSQEKLEELGLPSSMCRDVEKGINLLMNGDYSEAQTLFSNMVGDFPGRPEGHIGLALSYQGRMFENSDFAFESQYSEEFKKGMKSLNYLLKVDKVSPWLLFLKGGSLGIDGLYNLRKRNFLKGIIRGADAIDYLKDCQRLKPDFYDPFLGFGLYDFYRSLWTKRLKFLPFFKDRLDEGLEELAMAEKNGLIVSVAAKLCLAWANFDLNRTTKTLEYCLEIKERFPDAVMNNLLLGEALRKSGRMREAIEPFRNVLSKNPYNLWASYSLAHTLYSLKTDIDDAITLIERYIENQSKKDKRADGYSLLGELYLLKGENEKALQSFKIAKRLNSKDEGVRRRLKELEGD